MTIPHFINEAKSDMLGIKYGWYAIDNAGRLSSGPFSSHKECLSRDNPPINELIPSTNEVKQQVTALTRVEGSGSEGSIRNRTLKDKAS